MSRPPNPDPVPASTDTLAITIELMRLRRMIVDRNDFLTKKGLWEEFCNWRPSDEPKTPRSRWWLFRRPDKGQQAN